VDSEWASYFSQVEDEFAQQRAAIEAKAHRRSGGERPRAGVSSIITA
jgi:hypothetical protein